jgi:hypothetical protein
MTDTLSEDDGSPETSDELSDEEVELYAETSVDDDDDVDDEDSEDEEFEELPPVYRVMDVEDVVLDLPAQFPSVTMVEAEPPFRTLVFPIGMAEGTALSVAMRGMYSPRPMTHELFMEVMQRVHIDVIAVRLVGRENGNYLAELDLMTPAGRERFECRPSDALVLALRMPVTAPVLVDERLLEDAGDVEPQWSDDDDDDDEEYNDEDDEQDDDEEYNDEDDVYEDEDEEEEEEEEEEEDG